MKIRLYMPYIDCDNISFDSKYELTSQQYIDNMKKEVDENGQEIFDTMSNGIEKIGDAAKFKINSSKNETEDIYKYAECECIMLDINKNDMTIENLIKYFQAEETFAAFLEMNPDTMDEEFETEIRLWKNTHEKINGYKLATDEWKAFHEPTRNIKMSLDFENGSVSYADLKNCRIFEVYNSYIFVVVVEKINFIKNI